LLLIINLTIPDSLLTQEDVHILKMTLANQEKIEAYRKNIAEALQTLDEIIAIIRFQDNPEDTIIDQKLEEIKKILNQ
jgi:enoyl-[acyl-carrier-protein] reductase (NADH)